jgi:hypothetical protein
MARLIWYLLVLAFVAALLVGASYAAAYSAVGTLLGAPPPQMGTQKAELLWKGAQELPGHPRAWKFSFGPTVIPGARSVTIYVAPTGQIIAMDPKNLPARLKLFHDPGL